MRPPQMSCRDLAEAMPGITAAFAGSGYAATFVGPISSNPRWAAEGNRNQELPRLARVVRRRTVRYGHVMVREKRSGLLERSRTEMD